MTDERGRGEVEFRSNPTDFGVDFKERTIELVAMPYDVDAAVIVHGRSVTESCAPGAFDGCDRRANRVSVNLNHDREKHVGRAFALHPSRTEGLVAELKIGRSLEGDYALSYAADQLLDASVGFAVMRGGEQWLEQRSRRRLTRCYLDHIALVPEGAYPGRVLSVRASEDAEPEARVLTPNLDEVLAWWGR
jgi:phage head maturation protease